MNASKQIDQNDPIVSTAETLAKEHGVKGAAIIEQKCQKLRRSNRWIKQRSK
jgi:hypothetical protein